MLGTGGGLVEGIVALMVVPISSGPTAQYLRSVRVCNTATPGDVGNYRGAGVKRKKMEVENMESRSSSYQVLGRAFGVRD